MRYSLDERQIAKLKPLVLGHAAARFIELPTRLGSVAPWDKVVRVLQAEGLELGRNEGPASPPLPAEERNRPGRLGVGAPRERSFRWEGKKTAS